MYEFLNYQTQDVMATEVVSVGPDTPLAGVEAVFEKHDFNGLPVVSEDQGLVGFVTKLDLLRAFECDEGEIFAPYEEIMQRPVRSVMSTEVRVVTPRTPLTRVLTKMLDRGAKSFPVLDPDRRLVGVIGREDVMRALRRAVAGVPATARD